MHKEKKYKGIRTAYVFIPTIILIAIFYGFALTSTIIINNVTGYLYNETVEASECINYVTAIQAKSSKMSETATSYVHNPIQMNPTKPVGPLEAYYLELTSPEKQLDYIRSSLLKYNLGDEIMNNVDACLEASENMQATQCHAFYLLDSCSDLTIAPVLLEKVGSYTLTDEEASLTDAEKKDVAFDLLLSIEYTDYKALLSNKVTEVTDKITNNTDSIHNDYAYRLKLMRGFMWGSNLGIIVINFIFFFILIRRLILPINRFAKKISNNQRLDEKHSLYEANYLASSYNNLLDRHAKFDEELREVAEYDSLTGLPNRYCYNEFLKNPPSDKKDVCIFIFDINKLKYTNDTFGHLKGDELIKTASECIKECFLDDEGKNCYRIGGDEFVAIVYDITPEDAEVYVKKFEALQKKNNISIAIGYEHSNGKADIDYEKLFVEADQKMYIDKELKK